MSIDSTDKGFPRTAKNVLQIWHENGRKLPFVVQKSHWSKDSFFLVTHVEMSGKQTERFERTGDLYGKAYGFFGQKGHFDTIGRPVELQNSGVYKWRLVPEEKRGPSTPSV